MNTFWILDGGYVIEAKDRLVLDDPDGSILSKIQGRLERSSRSFFWRYRSPRGGSLHEREG